MVVIFQKQIDQKACSRNASMRTGGFRRHSGSTGNDITEYIPVFEISRNTTRLRIMIRKKLVSPINPNHAEHVLYFRCLRDCIGSIADCL